ncbi:MAG: hypothetical protein ACREIT_01195 [Tepidisphaeraceae bacterium]
MTIMQKLLNTLSTVSLLLLLSSLFLWARSYFVLDMASTQSGGVHRMWSTNWGRIGFGIYNISPDNGYNHAWTWNKNVRPGGTAPVAGGTFWEHQRFGVGWDVRGSLPFTMGGIRYRQTAREWWIAYWLPMLLATPLSTIAVWRIARWTARRARVAMERRRDKARGFPLDLPSQHGSQA